MKYKILEELKKQKESYVSGQKLSVILNVSRTAIWKHIVELRNEGYSIAAVSRKGYKLNNSNDILNMYELSGIQNIRYYESVSSTNDIAKQLAVSGSSEWTVVVADNQTAGKGRLGRKWITTPKKGIWMSILLKPCIPPWEIQLMTLAASCAVALALKDTVNVDAGIKWPNDVLIEGKKVCGILLEMNSEADRINHIVAGIGINFSHEMHDFPKELANTATSVKISLNNNGRDIEGIKRYDIIKAVIKRMKELYEQIQIGNAQPVLDGWRKYNVTLGKNVKVIYHNKEYTGIATELTNEGNLTVLCEDGIKRTISSGEVSVRGLMNYI